jgi:hypothetical protein
MYQQQITEKLKKLKLKPTTSISKKVEEARPYFSSVVLDAEKNTAFFKSSLSNDSKINKSLANEVYILKQISTLNNGTHIILPNLIKARVSKNFVWHVREYIEGDNFGNWQSGFDTSVLDNLQFAKKLALGIYYIQVHLRSIADDKKLNVYETKNTKKQAVTLAKKLSKEKIISIKTENAILNKIDKIKIQETSVFCHGNITPENILQKKNDVGLINWKDAVIGNPALDLACVWVFALNNKKWQNAFIDAYLELSSNQTIVKQYLELEKISRLLYTLNRFKEESQIKTIKNGKKKFYNLLQKTLSSLI